MGFVQAEDGLAVVTQMEGHIKARQCQALDHFLQVIEFGFFSLEELASRRGIEKQVAHFHRGAHRMGRWLDPRGHVAAFGLDLPGLVGIPGAGCQGQARHGTDGGQGLAAEPQAHHLLEIFQVADLAGGVTGQG